MNALMVAPRLEMQNIGKRFGGVVALEGVQLSVSPGEIVALIGENGAGKSTLMKILGGVHRPDTGTIHIEGQLVTISSVADANRHGIGFIHQELNVLDNLDIASNLFLGREPVKGGPLRLIDQAQIYKNAEIYLQRIGLNLPGHTPLRNLSLAQQQMVEIARALSLNARLLIMDEPTSSLTLAETERLLTVAKELRSQGVSLIYISHRLGEVQAIADRVVALRDGKNAGELSRDEIQTEAMVRLMVGRDIDRVSSRPESLTGAIYLEVRDLRTQRYPQQTVSFTLKKGEILGFAGLVGAGRSEVMQAIFGVEPALSGTLLIDGEPVTIRSPQDAIRRGIYLAPEDRRHSGVLLNMTVRENITLPALFRYAANGFLQREKEVGVAEEFRQRLNIKAPSVESLVGNLSGGNQQKVVLAKWLSQEPKVLIVDEPTRGIDVGARAEIYALLRRLTESGIAVLMVSSDMEEVLNISDRIAVMHEGRITGILPQHEASEEAVMRLAVGNV